MIGRNLIWRSNFHRTEVRKSYMRNFSECINILSRIDIIPKADDNLVLEFAVMVKPELCNRVNTVWEKE